MRNPPKKYGLVLERITTDNTGLLRRGSVRRDFGGERNVPADGGREGIALESLWLGVVDVKRSCKSRLVRRSWRTPAVARRCG
jgi:hypothetical protein